MLGSTVLEVVIGLSFLYFLLSVIASWCQERVAAFFELRAATLEASLHALLESKLAKQILGHSVANPLAGRHRPSYISSRAFAEALLAIVAPVDPAKGRTFDETRALVAAAQLPDRVRTALLSAIDTAAGDLASVRGGVERWFDDAMNRASGLYRRRAAWIGLGIAAMVTLALNADSGLIANHLWSNASARSAVVSAASSSSGEEPTTAGAGLNELRRLPIPLGWPGLISSGNGDPRLPTGYGGWLKRVCGWLLTTLAVSLGAPFWFDLLNKTLRMTGIRPEPSNKGARS